MKKGITKSMWERTLIFFSILIAAIIVFNIGALFFQQIVLGEKYQVKAQEQQLSDKKISPSRGTIYDSNMNVIAESTTAWNVYIDPKRISNVKKNDKSKQEEESQELIEARKSLIFNFFSELFAYDEEEKAELKEKINKSTTYVEIEKKVDYQTKVKISEFISNKENKKYKLAECIGLTQTTKRYYPSNNFASTVVGFTGSDDQGLYGVEKYYDEILTGVPGRIVTAKDALANALPNEYETAIDAQNGSNLVLTIDQTIQYYLEKGMEDVVKDYNAKGAYGVVMNPNTGAVLAMSTKPDFDANNPWQIDYERTQKEIDAITDLQKQNEQRSLALQKQWRNSTISDIYVPGSVFKPFVAAAALEEKVVSLNTTYTCTGSIKVGPHIMKCHYHAGHGLETLTQGLENSCNPFFITVGQKLGAEKFYKYYDAFGFTEKTGIDLPGEAKPYFLKEEQLGLVQLSSASIGQTNSITPIQMCTALCAIANGGKVLQPYVVKEILDSQGNTVSKTQTVVKRQAVSEETAKTVLNMMLSVVENGTGKNGYVAGYRVAGKTGTSTKLGESGEGEKNKYLASFAAIAPADDPQLVCLVIIDEPDQDLGGGALAAPICATVIEQALKHLNVEPKYTEEELKKLDIKVPNVVNQTVASAQTALKNAGLNFKVVGNGDKIIKQSPAGGTAVPAGANIVLYTEENNTVSTVKVPNFMGMTVAQANAAAAAAGVNIKLVGNNLSQNDVVAYRQSEAQDSEVAAGTVVSVYFKHTSGVSDMA